MHQKIVSRREAISQNLDRYFTGKPCKNGHVSERAVQGKCLSCYHDKSAKNSYHHQWSKRNKGKIKEWSAKRYKSAEYKEYCAERYAQNREKSLSATRKWQIKNPEKMAAARSRRRARNKNAEGSFTADDISAIFLRQKKKCANCLKKITKYHVDHIKPLAKGGSNWPKNIQLLCQSCNHRKWAKDPIEFAQQEGRLL